MKPSSSKRFATLLGVGALAFTGLGLAETPAQQAIHLRIPSQPIGEALNAFAEQSGLQLLFRSELGEGVTAPAVQGVLSAQQALELLLAQSGLKYEFINPHTVTVRSAEADSQGASDEATTSGKEGDSGPFVVAQTAGTDPDRASPHSQPTNAEADETLAEIIVVGTLLRDTTPTSPVVTFTRSDIERGGYMNVQDLLAKTPRLCSSCTATSMTASLPCLARNGCTTLWFARVSTRFSCGTGQKGTRPNPKQRFEINGFASRPGSTITSGTTGHAEAWRCLG